MDRYITFGDQYRREVHPVLGLAAHPDGWLRITNLPAGPPEQANEHARQYIFRMLGQRWAFDYDEQPDETLFTRGELGVLDFDTDRITLCEVRSRQIYPLKPEGH